MTLLDWIVLGIIKSDAQAERAARDLVDLWHADRVPGALENALGLSPREYQAWTTGGVSLLTIAAWRRTQPPALDKDKPWFKLSGRPGREKVGYLENLHTPRARRIPSAIRGPGGKLIVKAPTRRPSGQPTSSGR